MTRGHPPPLRNSSPNAKGEDLATLDRIEDLISEELTAEGVTESELADFRDAIQKPRALTVNFCGGITQTCWAVTRPNGPYRVFYMPQAGYFSLCIDSMFGPVDMGVHGRAVDCYGSV